jgi:integrase
LGGVRPSARLHRLRICEAFTLTCGDVDLAGSVLTVSAGKRGRARLVPLHPSAVPPLREYATDRRRHFGPPAGSAAFFRTDRSDRVSYNAANSTFTVLRRQLGWTAAGRARTPRVHDLRHRMVVRRIQTWHAQGIDANCKNARSWPPTEVTWRRVRSTGTSRPSPN